LLQAGGRHPAAYVEIQGLSAYLYGLSTADYCLVLESLPLVEADVRQAAAECHRRLAERLGRV
jgi:hypothetical protein